LVPKGELKAAQDLQSGDWGIRHGQIIVFVGACTPKINRREGQRVLREGAGKILAALRGIETASKNSTFKGGEN